MQSANAIETSQSPAQSESSPLSSQLWLPALSLFADDVMQGAEDDVEMADAPDEYLDPITYTLMQDPVKLPSGAVMDRPNVMRMLLTDPRDPTTRLVRLIYSPRGPRHGPPGLKELNLSSETI